MNLRALLPPAFVFMFAGFACAQRPATDAEKEFYSATRHAIKAALPSCPEGWRSTEWDMTPLDHVPTYQAKEPFRVNGNLECFDDKKKNSADAKIGDAMLADMKSRENDPQLAALNQEIQRLAKAMADAVGKGDIARTERINRDIDAAGAKVNAVQEARDKDFDRVRAANEAHDVYLRIIVSVNGIQHFAGVTYRLPGVDLPIYRVSPGGHIFKLGWKEEQNDVVIGRGVQTTTTPAGLSTVKFTYPVKSPYLAAYVIQVTVIADPERARQVLGGIQWKALLALIK